MTETIDCVVEMNASCAFLSLIQKCIHCYVIFITAVTFILRVVLSNIIQTLKKGEDKFPNRFCILVLVGLPIDLFVALCYTFDLEDYMSTTTQNVFQKIRKYVQVIITSRYRYNLHRITLCSCNIAKRIGNILRDIIGHI